jgi:RNA polymerase sigma-70 factor (ECF subfamily)
MIPSPLDHDPDSPLGPALEITGQLLDQAKAGDAAARERLFARVMPSLRRWAHQRLPRSSRDLQETDDLVQVTLLRAWRRLDEFDFRGPGSFLGYLRQILLNALRDEVRRTGSLPPQGPLATNLPAAGPSPLEETMGWDAVRRYEAAFLELDEEEKLGITLRLELGLGYAEIAEVMGKPSANAARMAVGRALVELAERMRGRD